MCSFYYALGPFTRRHFECTVGAGAQSVPHSAIYYTFVQTKKKMKNADKNKNNERKKNKTW